jgi:hypothetical protein
MPYHPKMNGVNPTPISGSFLAHNHAGMAARAFTAADLVRGVKYPFKLTQVQAAALARVNRNAVYWALKQEALRADIEAGRIPLIPNPKTNGMTASGIDDAGLVRFVRSVGVHRMFEAVVAAEAAE